MTTRVIGVISGKGGVGKTVVSINTAAALHRYYNFRVLLIDCNITTSHLGLYLGLYSTPVTLNDALQGKVGIEKTIYEHQTGVHVIPASLRLEDLKNVDWHIMKERIKPLHDKYDFIILDSSPGFNRESLITLQASDEVIMVTTPIVHHIADVIKCKQLCKELDIRPIGIVLNMTKNRKYELTRHEVEQMTELPVFTTLPYDEAVLQSIIYKMPVINHSKKMSRHFLDISKFIVGGDLPEEEGFFSGLRRLLWR